MCAKRRIGDFAVKNIAYNNLSYHESLLNLPTTTGEM